MKTASEIIDALKQKHCADVFVAECKDGQTWGHMSHKRLDAWVMKRSYRPITMIGYEVKASRSNFMRDDKWHSYRNLCHEFYFVCPHGVITVHELPEAVGLLWVSKTGSRLYTKRKAVRQEIDLPVDLLIYVLMSRAHIDSAPHGRDRWEEWLKQRTLDQLTGTKVSARMRELWGELRRENASLKRLMDSYTMIRARIVELGFNPDDAFNTWRVVSKLDELVVDVSTEFVSNLRDARDELDGLLKVIEAERTQGSV